MLAESAPRGAAAQRGPGNDARTPEQLREHYAIERELAGRLRNASRQERRHLYASLYDEMYRRVPLHPQLARRASAADTRRAVASQLRFLGRFLRRDTVFLEVGAGDCALAFEVAGRVRQVYAVDVSDEISRRASAPSNFRLIRSDGTGVPLPPSSVTVAYSNQLMEHLHPDDALDQLKNIYAALRPGGIYVCITPNRLDGPHDISRHFSEVAEGFHLKEYTTLELSRLFRQTGFWRVRVYLGAKSRYIRLPVAPIGLWERLVERMPPAPRKSLVRSFPFRLLTGIRLVGIK